MKKIIFALMLGLAAVACTTAEYDDTAIKEQIADLDGRLDKVEEDLATLQLNVDAMKTLAQALKDGMYIVSYVALENNAGYTLTFSDNTTITVTNGVDGVNGDKGDKGDKGNPGDKGDKGDPGVTPTVTVKENAEGVLCWYINDVEGKPVYAETPKFTSADGVLYVTYPGEEPEAIGALTGVSIFKTVEVLENTVKFTFVGENGEAGDSFELPLAEKFELVIDAKVALVAGATSVEIPYEVKGGEAVVDVLAFSCEAVVEAEVIKVSNIAEGAQVLVFADNGEGKASIKKITFFAEKEEYSVEAVDEVIPAEGGQVTVKGVSNVAFDVVIPAEATWLTQVVAKSAFELTFAAEANETTEVREAEVAFVRAGTEDVLMTVTIAQAAAEVQVPFAELVWSSAVPFGGGQDRNMTMDSEYVYVAQAAGGDGVIKAYSIADGSYVKDVKVATKVSVSTNGTHAISCVRVMPNTDAAINGGKDVLVASNLTTGDGKAKLTVYVWANGIDADPNYFVIDSGTRRLGDKFTTRGTIQGGELLFFDYNDGNTVIRVNMKDGVAGLWPQGEIYYATGRYAVPVGCNNNIGECTIHPDATFDGDGNPTALLVTTNTAGKFLNQTAGNAYEVSAWGVDPDLGQTFGYNFFSHNDKDYIAYVKLAADRNSAALNVIEDVNGAADFKGTLETKTGLFTAPLVGTGNAGHGVADCATAVAGDVRYIAVMAQNIGISVYKLN